MMLSVFFISYVTHVLVHQTIEIATSATRCDDRWHCPLHIPARTWRDVKHDNNSFIISAKLTLNSILFGKPTFNQYFINQRFL
jgi:hypothetical protein